MELPEEEKLNVAALIEKYKFWIGGVLLLLVIINGGYLLYRENFFKPAVFRQLDEQARRIDSLEGEILELKELVESKELSTLSRDTESNTESTQLNATDSGKVAGASTPAKVSGKVNINTADLSQLDTLPGIGPAYAQRIIDYRTTNGGFKSTEEVLNIKGIGPKTYEKFKNQITL